MSKSINNNTNITLADALIISKIEELTEKNAGAQPSEIKYPHHDTYVDANGETVHVWKSREYRLSDLKNKAIPEFDVDEVARYMLIDWASILHELHIADLDDIKYVLDNAHTYLVHSIHDSIVWEVAATDALVDVTNNIAFQEWENYIELFLGTDHEEFRRYYKYVYDKLADRLSDLSEKYVLMFARNRLYDLLIEAKNAANNANV